MDEAQLRAEGWRSLTPHRFSGAIGKTWARGQGAELTLGMLAEEHVANENIGIVHGGALMTFADMALGSAVSQALGGMHCVTAQMQFHFVAAARIGSFITCCPEIVRRTSQLVFLRALVESEGRTLAACDGIFKVLDDGKLANLSDGKGVAYMHPQE